nr:hypothetical protein [Tanacetum cinerariifolium]
MSKDTTEDITTNIPETRTLIQTKTKITAILNHDHQIECHIRGRIGESNQLRINESPSDYQELEEAVGVSRENPSYQIPYSYHNCKPKHEIVYKPPLIQNENNKGDVAFIEVDVVKPMSTMPNTNPIISNSLTVSPFLKDCTMHITYTNEQMFADDVLSNHVGDKELNSIDGIRNGVLTKKEIKKDEMGILKEHNKEWKFNEKVVPHNEEFYHYL